MILGSASTISTISQAPPAGHNLVRLHKTSTERLYTGSADAYEIANKDGISVVCPTWTKLTHSHKSSRQSVVTIWHYLFAANQQMRGCRASRASPSFSSSGTAADSSAQHGRNQRLSEYRCCCCWRSIDRIHRWLTIWQVGRWRHYYSAIIGATSATVDRYS